MKLRRWSPLIVVALILLALIVASGVKAEKSPALAWNDSARDVVLVSLTIAPPAP